MNLFARLKPFLAIFISIQLLIRISLLARVWVEMSFSPLEYAGIFLLGSWFDLITAAFVVIPVVIGYLFLPIRWESRAGKVAFRFVFSYSVLFGVVAEHLFWTEFSTRFNFIAVDYLVYTQEVIGNIVESYPLGWLLSGIAVVAALVVALSLWVFPLAAQPARPALRARGKQVAVFVVLCLVLYGVGDSSQAQFKGNSTASELASNGTYNLFYAFWNNEIDYDRFYAKESRKNVARTAHALLEEEYSQYLTKKPSDLTRVVISPRPEQHKNVMLVVMESLSAEYMASFGNTRNLTPNLDNLAKKSLFFTDTYATGTRTVRGLEAVSLSIPPTPGQSIVRRPDNHDLFSIGYVFKDRGYDTRFIYGGYGYFDNMNAYFAGNGFKVTDRTDIAKEHIQFGNVWGICDEDLYAEAIRKADESVAKGKPFLNFLMTTSNHRPYTYPEGKIDIASRSGREGGLKYADYSIGQFIKAAKKKPWFNDTVFIFVADHTAGAGGKMDLNPQRYHIPMMFYAPKMIKPQRYEAMASQIDLAPMLLGMLDFTYISKFYGRDLLKIDNKTPHSFISNYQKVALVKQGTLTVLEPKQNVEQFSWPEIEPLEKQNKRLIHEAIGYYQSASWWRQDYRRIPTVPSAEVLRAHHEPEERAKR